MAGISEKGKQSRAEYYRQWRKRPENQGKTKQYQEAYWNRKAEQQEQENEKKI